MNAKFEKWFDDVCGVDTNYNDVSDAWQAAIQSLEVNPELIRIAVDAYDNNGLEVALKAFLSALKEQAK